MNKPLFDITLVEHFFISVALTVIGFIAGYFIVEVTYVGAGVAIAWFVCRECVRAEYEWIKLYGKGLRSNMPWWAFLDPKVWDVPSVLDVLSAVLGVCFASACRFIYYQYFI